MMNQNFDKISSTLIVVPESLRPTLPMLAHSSRVAGHPRQNHMFYMLFRMYYWPQMAVKIAAIVRNCHSLTRNRVRLRTHLNQPKLFPATRPSGRSVSTFKAAPTDTVLEAVSTNDHGLLYRANKSVRTCENYRPHRPRGVPRGLSIQARDTSIPSFGQRSTECVQTVSVCL